MRQPADGLDHGRQRVRVVAVIDHHRRPVNFQDVEAAGHLVGVGGNDSAAGADHLHEMPMHQAAATVAMAFSTWNATWPLRVSGSRSSGRRTSSRSPSARITWRSRTNTARPPAARWRTITGLFGVEGKESHGAGATGRHIGDQRIGGVEHGVARSGNRLDNAPFHLGQFLGRIDVGEAQVVALADIRHDGHVAEVEAEPLAENAAAGSLENGHVDARIDQDAPGALRAAAIAVVDAAIVDENAIGARHSDAMTSRRAGYGR